MNREEVKAFVREVVGRGVEFHDYDKWVSFSCPLSPWTHSTGQDRSASAGISIGDQSFYNCYACKTKGPLSRFLTLYQRFSGRDFSHLIAEVKDGEYLGGSMGQWGGEDKETTLGEPLDKEVYFDLYESVSAVPVARTYLRERGIDKWTAEELNLLFDPEDSDGDARILFPVCAPNGDLHGFTGRAISSKARLKVRDYHGLKKKLLLLGSHLIQRNLPAYVILVEGLFDFANMVKMGYPAVATMKSDLSREQADILLGFRVPVYVFYDDDEAGRKGLESVRDELCKHLPVSKVRYPKKPRIVDAKTGKLRPPNDPGELNEDEVALMIRDSRLV